MTIVILGVKILSRRADRVQQPHVPPQFFTHFTGNRRFSRFPGQRAATGKKAISPRADQRDIASLDSYYVSCSPFDIVNIRFSRAENYHVSKRKAC